MTQPLLLTLTAEATSLSLSLLYKKEELVLFPPVECFVLHIFHMTILPSHRTPPNQNESHQAETKSTNPMSTDPSAVAAIAMETESSAAAHLLLGPPVICDAPPFARCRRWRRTGVVLACTPPGFFPPPLHLQVFLGFFPFVKGAETTLGYFPPPSPFFRHHRRIHHWPPPSIGAATALMNSP